MDKEEVIIKDTSWKDTSKWLPYFEEHIKNKKILDLGCGSGLGAVYIMRRCKAQFHLLDREDLRDKKAKKLPFTLASADKLPLKNKEFDVIYMQSVLHHLNKKISIKKVLSEALRVADKLIIIEEVSTKRTNLEKALNNDKKFNKMLHPNSTFEFTKYYTNTEIKSILKSINSSFKSQKLSTGSVEYGGLDVYMYLVS